MHIYVSKLTIIGSDNGLSPDRHQAIIWTKDRILLIGPLGTNFSEILIKIHAFSFKKMYLKMSSGKWRPFCLGLNVLSYGGVCLLFCEYKLWFMFCLSYCNIVYNIMVYWDVLYRHSTISSEMGEANISNFLKIPQILHMLSTKPCGVGCISGMYSMLYGVPDSKVHGASMGPIWGWQDPGGPHVGPMNLAIWGTFVTVILYVIYVVNDRWSDCDCFYSCHQFIERNWAHRTSDVKKFGPFSCICYRSWWISNYMQLTSIILTYV